MIILYNVSGEFNCSGNAKSDFSDIRFTNSSGNGLIPYWIENYTSDTRCNIWICNEYNESTLYLYYGNSGASDASDGDSTFLFFDDFNDGTYTDKWDKVGTGTVTESGGTITVDISVSDTSVYSKNTYAVNTAIRSKFRVSNSADSDYAGFGYGNKGATGIVGDSYTGQGCVIGCLHSTEQNYIDGRQTNNGVNRDETVTALITGSGASNYHIYDITRKSASGVYRMDGGTSYELSSYYPTISLYAGIGGQHADSCSAISDWFLIRLYASSEPGFAFGIEEPYTGGWFNSAPVITDSSENPPDTQTNVDLILSNFYNHFNISVTDVDDANQTMNVTWRTNETTGIWHDFDENLSVDNGTYYATNISWIDDYSTTYYWSVNVSDGNGGWDNETFSFTTRKNPVSWYSINFGGTLYMPNDPPVISNIYPTNGTTIHVLTPDLHVLINDSDADLMTLNWYEGNTTDFDELSAESNLWDNADLTNNGAIQGSCANATYVWVSYTDGSDNGYVRQYWRSNQTLKDTLAVYTYCSFIHSGDLDYAIIDDIPYVYVAMCNHPTNDNESIAVIWASNLTFKEEILLQPMGEYTYSADGIDYEIRDGVPYWWVREVYDYGGGSEACYIGRYPEDFDIAERVYYLVEGDALQGLTWYKDYLFMTRHLIDSVLQYMWNGSGFDFIGYFNYTDGLCPEDTYQGIRYLSDEDKFIIAQRDHVGSWDALSFCRLIGWKLIQTNNSCTNGTYYCEYTNASVYNFTYYWKVTANDTYNGWDNETLHFYLEEEPTPPSPPVISNPYPSDDATGIILNPDCNITIYDNGGSTTVYFYTKDPDTSIWTLRQTNTSMPNGNVIFYNFSKPVHSTPNGTMLNTRYTWSANATDGVLWTNHSYNFTTALYMNDTFNNAKYICDSCTGSGITYDFERGVIMFNGSGVCYPEVRDFQGFEVDFGNWTNSGCTRATKYHHTGAYSCLMGDSGDSITYTYDMSNYHDLNITFFVLPNKVDTDDPLVLSFYNGTDLNILHSYTVSELAEGEWNYVKFWFNSTDPGGGFASNSYIRLGTPAMGAPNDGYYVDDVYLNITAEESCATSNFTSKTIQKNPADTWDRIYYTVTPYTCNIRILNATTNETIITVANGEDISSLTDPGIKLNAYFFANTTLYDWNITTVSETSYPTVTFGTPDPVNGSSGNPLALTWSILVNKSDGEAFDCSVECSNGQFNDSYGEYNRTVSIDLSGLEDATEYTVWVNVSYARGTNKTWYTFTTGTWIDIEVNVTTWTIGELLVDTSIQRNFTFYQNGSSTIRVDIGFNNTNYTFVNYTTWLANGGDQYCANFTIDSWSSEHMIEPKSGDTPITILKDSLSGSSSFEFGIRIWMPKGVTASGILENFAIMFVATDIS